MSDISNKTDGAFVFFDCETTGLSPHYDQILQFAAVKTDADFNIMEVRVWRCRRLPHIVPSAKAMLITGANPDSLENQPLSHFEMIREIFETLTAWSPATFIGYSSLRFDEELLRHNLFASLLPPYVTMGAGCSRADMLVMLKAFSIHAPSAISLPVIDGKISMRLGNVARANGMTIDHEHDALGDVLTTIRLARLMKAKSAELFAHLIFLGSRVNVSAFIADHGVMQFSTWYGKPNVKTVAPIAVNLTNRNEQTLWNLDFEPEPYFNLSVEALREALQERPRAIEVIRLNAAPILTASGMMTFAASESGTDFYTMMARSTAIRMNGSFQAKVSEPLALRQAQRPTSSHVEEQLYSGSFPSYRAKRASRRFVDRGTSWDERAKIAADMEDERLRIFAFRILFHEAPASLPADIELMMRGWLTERLLGEDVPWRTIHDFCFELNALRAEAQQQIVHEAHFDSDGENALLDDLEFYALTLASGLR